MILKAAELLSVSNFVVDELLLLYLNWLIMLYIDYRDMLYAYIVLTDSENHTDVESKTGNQETKNNWVVTTLLDNHEDEEKGRLNNTIWVSTTYLDNKDELKAAEPTMGKTVK